MDRDLLRRPLPLVVFLGLLLLYLTGHGYLFSPKDGADAIGCRTVSMYPSFGRIKSFDESHTRFALKFSLYLYREQGKDPIPRNENEGFEALNGIPALFIPGNAGSYRQMRSIAAEVSNLYFDENINVVANENARNYDFFGADFNEDYTAFHGRTMLDQAEFLNEAIRFILLLYANHEHPPTSVLILAHSMGGIVARVLPTLPNYVPGSINTIVTLSSPHSAAPLTFDGDILKIYLAIDRFWYDAFNPGPETLGVAALRLHNVSLVSITGGLLDSVLPADYTTLGFLVPPSNGFTVYTTGIPNVWTPMDHLAIVWCRQLRRTVAKMLLEIADVTSPHRTVPLTQRMEIMRSHLLSGFETYAKQDTLPPSESASNMKVRFDNQDVLQGLLPNTIWRSTNTSKLATSLPLLAHSTVLVLSDMKLTKLSGKPGGISVLLCRNAGDGKITVDLTRKSTNEYLELNCADLADELNEIPRSATNVGSLQDSAFDGQRSPFGALRLSSEDFKGFDQIVIVDKRRNYEKKRGFVIVELSAEKEVQHTLGKDMFSLVTRGADISLLPSSPLAVNLHIPGAWLSILAYRVLFKGLEKLQGGLFEPFVRQWKDEPYETKWHIKLDARNKVLVTMHGIAPYTPFLDLPDTRGLNLELWKDPELDLKKDDIETIDVIIKVDWISSLKLLVMRYRLAVVSQCLAVTILVTIVQLTQYFSLGVFPDYVLALLKLTQKSFLVPTLIILALLTPLTKLRWVQTLLDVIDPVVLHDRNELNLSLHKDFTLNSFYLGLQELVLCGVGCIFFFMAIGINFVLYYMLSLMGTLFGSVAVTTSAWRAKPAKKPTTATTEKASVSTMKRKIVTTAIIMCAVLFYLPYQFAYMVSVAIQAITTIKVMIGKSARSMSNYHISFLIMMLWVLPINVPVLVVFVHNLNIAWATPFSSHHNFLAVAPIVALSEVHSFFPELMPFSVNPAATPKTGKDIPKKVSLCILGYFVFYCIIYGARHTFWLHHLFNVWCSWLLVGFLEQIMKTKDTKSK